MDIVATHSKGGMYEFMEAGVYPEYIIFYSKKI